MLRLRLVYTVAHLQQHQQQQKESRRVRCAYIQYLLFAVASKSLGYLS